MNTVGLLLVTHPALGPALIATATAILGQLPLKTEAFEVPFDASPDTLLPAASAALRKVDTGAGVLILSDLYGATPPTSPPDWRIWARPPGRFPGSTCRCCFAP